MSGLRAPKDIAQDPNPTCRVRSICDQLPKHCYCPRRPFCRDVRGKSEAGGCLCETLRRLTSRPQPAVRMLATFPAFLCSTPLWKLSQQRPAGFTGHRLRVRHRCSYPGGWGQRRRKRNHLWNLLRNSRPRPLCPLQLNFDPKRSHRSQVAPLDSGIS